MRYPVVVVGAGPAGLFLARKLGEAGVDVAVLEEHPAVGKPEHCTGLFSPRVIRLSGADAVIREFRGAVFHAPTGETVEVRSSHTKAHLVDRVEFDRVLATAAVRAGAHIYLGARVTGMERRGSSWALSTPAGEFRADVVVGADGAGSYVRRAAGLEGPGRRVATVQAMAALDVEDVHVFLGDFARGFFGWVVPHYDGLAKIGIGSPDGRAHESFRAFVERISGMWDFQVLSMNSWVIPVGGLRKYAFPGGCVIGDAAALAKATTGGGVFTALRSAELASRAIVDHLRRGEKVERYETLLKRELLPHVRTHMRLHSIYASLTDRDLSYIFTVLSREENAEIVSSLGDVDFPLKSLVTLVKRDPRLLGFLPKLLKAVR